MHRSGTSLCASVLDACGVSMGDRLLAPDARNRPGYFEDVDLVDLDGRILTAACGPAGPLAHPDWGWNPGHEVDADVVAGFRSEAEALSMRYLDRAAPFGLKDPRVTLLLDLWDDVLPSARYLVPYRAPWDVVDSMQRLGHGTFLNHPEVCWAIWCQYNRAALAFVDANPERAVLVNAAVVARHPSLVPAVLADRLGVVLPEQVHHSLADRSLFRDITGDDPLPTLAAATQPEAVELFGALEDVSAAPGADLWGSAPLRLTDAPPDPRVSVAITAHADRDHLVEAVASVERSAIDGTEVTIVDDGATDERTLAVLAALESLGYRVLRRENAGVGVARDRGFSASAAPYLVALDGDNRILPPFLAAGVAALDADPRVGVVYGDALEFGARSGRREVPDFALGPMLRMNLIDMCAVVRREVWTGAGGFARGIDAWADWSLWLSAAAAGWSFARLSDATFEYRVRPGSMLAQADERAGREALLSRMVELHEDLYRSGVEELVAAADDELARLRATYDDLVLGRSDYVERQRAHLGRLHADIDAIGADLALVESDRDRVRAGVEAAERDLANDGAFLDHAEGTLWWRARMWLSALVRAR